MLTRKGQDLVGVVALMVSLAVASSVAIFRIHESQRVIDVTLNSSPLGYTYSLALFVLPCAIFGVWLCRSHRTPLQRRASFLALALLIPVGFILDIFFGRVFLSFPNL